MNRRSKARRIPWDRIRSEARERFGVDRFRPGQRELIEAALAGRDALGILPTGAGKSLCFQLPALFLQGTTVVVSPLIALMQDQTEKLAQADVEAARLDSTLAARDERDVERSIRRGAKDLVYVTPERLASPEGKEPLRAHRVSLFVVDEAHCISQWGHDFRPAYLGLGEAARELSRPPILALTATAPPRVVDDVVRLLGMEAPLVLSTGIDRENLVFEVRDCPAAEVKKAALLEIARGAGGAGIVYCSTIRTVDELHAWLRAEGIAAERYHGKLRAADREASQRRFMSGEAPAMVATSAFGMGVDKPDIRFIVHFSFPDSVESYYQEAGRAGRDGAPARAVLLYRKEDRAIQTFFLRGRYASRDALRSAWGALERAAPDAVPMERLGEATGLPPRKAAGLAAVLQSMGLARRSRGRLRKVRDVAGAGEWEAFLSAHERKREADRERLLAMVKYAQTALCRVRYLRTYFGEEPGERCGRCDNCRERPGVTREVMRTEEEARRKPGLAPPPEP